LADLVRVEAADFDWQDADGPAGVVRAVDRACHDSDGAAQLNEQAVLQLKRHGLDGASLWLARTSTVRRGVGGFALRRGDQLDLAVHPDARGEGLGTTLAAAALAGMDRVEAWSHADHPAAARIAEHHGVPRARELRIMELPADVPLPPVTTPDEVVVRTFRAGDEDALLAVNAAAFAHHPEQGRLSLADLRDRMAEDWFDPGGLFLAVDADDRLLGFHWTKEHREEEPAYGEVYVVATSPKAAGRGIGSLLTNTGLRHLRERGLGRVILYVEADNAPAITVYRRQGFRVLRTEVQYRGVPH
jgi:mycothiol synthase